MSTFDEVKEAVTNKLDELRDKANSDSTEVRDSSAENNSESSVETNSDLSRDGNDTLSNENITENREFEKDDFRSDTSVDDPEQRLNSDYDPAQEDVLRTETGSSEGFDRAEEFDNGSSEKLVDDEISVDDSVIVEEDPMSLEGEIPAYNLDSDPETVGEEVQREDLYESKENLDPYETP